MMPFWKSHDPSSRFLASVLSTTLINFRGKYTLPTLGLETDTLPTCGPYCLLPFPTSHQPLKKKKKNLITKQNTSSLSMESLSLCFISNGGNLFSVLLTLSFDPIDFSRLRTLFISLRIHFLLQILSFSFSSLSSPPFCCESLLRFQKLLLLRFICLLPLEHW